MYKTLHVVVPIEFNFLKIKLYLIEFKIYYKKWGYNLAWRGINWPSPDYTPEYILNYRLCSTRYIGYERLYPGILQGIY